MFIKLPLLRRSDGARLKPNAEKYVCVCMCFCRDLKFILLPLLNHAFSLTQLKVQSVEVNVIYISDSSR